ncbi:ATP-dependent DNA/RNA helicase DHX36-like [Xenia sp. Carnegie-2017]|uniref:ATP-dependent DNA/RNA helicase DHX36-like n=1 Tax=Xenia sp. Carnegie-2017 TaxID=2897299 RepID=UPI001F040128|nr:ATP-dependent DNA/RNA helicase DHX36-like [Xenia sp. Carnegie-2017]
MYKRDSGGQKNDWRGGYEERRRGGRGRGSGRGRGGGRGHGGGRGGHPPGLTGAQIGMWYKEKSEQSNIRKEREQRQEVSMSKSHEQHLRKMIDSLDECESSSSSTDQQDWFQAINFQENRFPRIMLKNDEVMNEILKKDLIDKKKLGDQMMEFRKKLPAFAVKDKIVDLVAMNQVVLISGETGCGKTTQVPQFILDDAIEKGVGSSCRVVCTQPRRISAISIAERVAQERGETVGNGSTGYQIRLESKPPRDQGSIMFCTIGVLLRWLMSDPNLLRMSHVIIDEIHERSILSDFLLIVVRDILPRRPALRVVLMSATLNADIFSEYFGGCPILNIPGFTFPVKQYFLEEIVKTLRYQCPPTKKRKLWGRRNKKDDLNREEMWKKYLIDLHHSENDSFTAESLANMDFEKIDHSLVEQLLMHIGRNMKEGAVLVFLPGWQDISALNDILKKNPFFSSDKFLVLPLHSLMPTVNQRQIFDRPACGVRKIILSTSLAETSITIDDVVFVVDCGKTKESNFDVDKQLSTLLPVWISKASSKQRKGRAGRVQEGVCFHLFTKFHYEEMNDYQLPEILRTPLEEICLQVKCLKLGMVESFLKKALQSPSDKSIALAIESLKQLNAFDSSENLTPLGVHLARLPVHPKIGKIILLGAIMSCLDPVLTIASSMGFRDPYVVPLEMVEKADKTRKMFSPGTQSDHLTLYEAFRKWEVAERCSNGKQFCWDNFLSFSVLKSIKNMKTQLAEHLFDAGFIESTDSKQFTANCNSENQSLIKGILCAGFYPNVIHVTHFPNSRRPPKLTVQQDGRMVRVEIHPKSVNHDEYNFLSNWLIYLEKVKSTKIFVQDCSTVSPYSLLFFGGDISTSVDEDEEIVTVDYWIKFNCRLSVAILVKRLREEFHRLLEDKIRNPCLTLNFGEKSKTSKRQNVVLKTIIDLITSD